jgi:hypothetical protein
MIIPSSEPLAIPTVLVAAVSGYAPSSVLLATVAIRARTRYELDRCRSASIRDYGEAENIDMRAPEATTISVVVTDIVVRAASRGRIAEIARRIARWSAAWFLFESHRHRNRARVMSRPPRWIHELV